MPWIHTWTLASHGFSQIFVDFDEFSGIGGHEVLQPGTPGMQPEERTVALIQTFLPCFFFFLRNAIRVSEIPTVANYACKS